MRGVEPSFKDSEAMIYPPSSPLGLCGLTETCRLLRVSRPTLLKFMREDPEFPRSILIGKRRFVRLADLKAWTDLKVEKANAE